MRSRRDQLRSAAPLTLSLSLIQILVLSLSLSLSLSLTRFPTLTLTLPLPLTLTQVRRSNKRLAQAVGKWVATAMELQHGRSAPLAWPRLCARSK